MIQSLSSFWNLYIGDSYSYIFDKLGDNLRKINLMESEIFFGHLQFFKYVF